MKSICLCCKQTKDLNQFNDKSNELGFCISCYELNETFTVKVKEVKNNNELKQISITNSSDNSEITYLQNQISVLTYNLAKLQNEFEEFKDLMFDLQIDSLQNGELEQKESQITFQEEIPRSTKELKTLDIDEIVSKLDYTKSNIKLDKALTLWYSLDDIDFKEIMIKVFNLTHKRQITSWNKTIEDWSNKYPDIVSRKINGIKKKLKEASKDLAKAKAAKDRYYSSENLNFRFPTIKKMLDSRGHLNISEFSVWSSLKTNYKWENEEIVNDLIAHKNDNPDNDIQIEDAYERKEITKFDLKGSYTNPSVMNTKDILNRYRE